MAQTDVAPDLNDITWCHVYVESPNGELQKILDDETA
jgi:hypothetical protein